MGPWVGFTATLTVALKCVTNQVAGRCVEAVGGAMSSNEWTPERIAALIALWGEDISTSEIGRRLGITKNAVIGKVHRLGLPKRRPSPIKILTRRMLSGLTHLEPICAVGQWGTRPITASTSAARKQCPASLTARNIVRAPMSSRRVPAVVAVVRLCCSDGTPPDPPLLVISSRADRH